MFSFSVDLPEECPAKAAYRSKRLLLFRWIRNAYRSLAGNPGALERVRFKVHYGFAVDGVVDLDGFAAHFAIFDVGLVRDRSVQDHRNLLPAIRARKEVLHAEYIIRWLGGLFERRNLFCGNLFFRSFREFNDC